MSQDELKTELESLTEILFADACQLKEVADLFAATSCSNDFVDYINRVAPNFGSVLQNAVSNYLVILVGRMSDGAGQGSRSRASFNRLKQHRDKYLPSSGDGRIESFLEKAEKLKKARNEFVAHRSLHAVNASGGSAVQYLELAELACDIVSDFCVDALGHDALFSTPRARPELAELLNSAGVGLEAVSANR